MTHKIAAVWYTQGNPATNARFVMERWKAFSLFVSPKAFFVDTLILVAFEFSPLAFGSIFHVLNVQQSMTSYFLPWNWHVSNTFPANSRFLGSSIKSSCLTHVSSVWKCAANFQKFPSKGWQWWWHILLGLSFTQQENGKCHHTDKENGDSKEQQQWQQQQQQTCCQHKEQHNN